MKTSASRPTCPFCHVDWSDAMLEQLDAFSGPTGCTCCNQSASVAALPVPTDDLRCTTCGRAIFRRPDLERR